jgi:hypothetical protein
MKEEGVKAALNDDLRSSPSITTRSSRLIALQESDSLSTQEPSSSDDDELNEKIATEVTKRHIKIIEEREEPKKQVAPVDYNGARIESTLISPPSEIRLLLSKERREYVETGKENDRKLKAVAARRSQAKELRVQRATKSGVPAVKKVHHRNRSNALILDLVKERSASPVSPSKRSKSPLNVRLSF